MTIKDYVLDRLNSFDEFIEQEDIEGIVEDVKVKYGVPCNYFNAGEYTSCGYDCWYYNIVWFENNELEGIDVQCESY